MPDKGKVIDCFQAALRMKNEHGFCILPFEPVEDALELLKAQELVEPAIGGNQNSCWYFICPRCQLAIDKGDKYCRHCGRAVKWDG